MTDPIPAPTWNVPYEGPTAPSAIGIPMTETGGSKPAQTPLPPLVEIVPPQKAVEPIKGNITGAGFLAGLFRKRIADTKATLAKAGDELNAALGDLEDVATQAVNQVKSVKAETADLKAALGLNSNGEQE